MAGARTGAEHASRLRDMIRDVEEDGFYVWLDMAGDECCGVGVVRLMVSVGDPGKPPIDDGVEVLVF